MGGSADEITIGAAVPWLSLALSSAEADTMGAVTVDTTGVLDKRNLREQGRVR